MENNIKKIRKKIGMSAAELARRIGMEPAALRRYDRGELYPRMDIAMRIADVLGCSVEDLRGDRPHPRDLPPIPSQEPQKPQPTSLPEHPEGKLPLYAYAAGSLDGEEVLFNSPYDYITRPPFIGSEANAYAVRVIGTSMEPRYFAGEVVYAVRGMPPRQGDFVVIQITSDDGLRAMVKQFVSIDNDVLRLKQFNPQQEIRIDREKVHALDTIKGSSS